MAYIVMAYIHCAMAYVVMACIAMAYSSYGSYSYGLYTLQSGSAPVLWPVYNYTDRHFEACVSARVHTWVVA